MNQCANISHFVVGICTTTCILDEHFMFLNQILGDKRFVHFLWYDILGCYFGMILRYFWMKIYYYFYLRKKTILKQ